MRTQTQAKIDLLVANTQSMKGKFIWHNASLKRLSALMYAIKNKEVDVHAIDEVYRMMKKNTSVFSVFRGNLTLFLATMLSLQGNPNLCFDGSLNVYKKLKKLKFASSDYLAFSAYHIASNSREEDYDRVVRRMKFFYDGMRVDHLFLTDMDDYIYAAMLALTDADLEAGRSQMRSTYNTLKPRMRSRNAVQAISHLLALGDPSIATADRVIDLQNQFRKKRKKLDRNFTYPILGILALLPVRTDELTQEVVDVFTYLRKQKGYRSWSIYKHELMLLSAAIVCSNYVDSVSDQALVPAVSSAIIGIIIAQYMAVLIAANTAAVMVATSATN